MRTGRPKAVLVLTEAERQALDSFAHRSRTAPVLARRARIVLECATGEDNRTVAKKLRLREQTVCKWAGASCEIGLEGFRTSLGPGLPAR